MTTFWIFIALVVLTGLIMIWVPHFRQQKLLQAEESGVRRQTNLELFAERLTILEKELKDDLLDQVDFEALKKELEINLLQDMKQKGDDSLDVEIKSKTALWPAFMTICLLAFSGYFYQQLGAYNELATSPSQASNPHQGMDPAQIISQRVQIMEAKVQAQPDDSQAWFSLGHAYISANQYNKAVAAFDKVIELVGTQAELLGPKATALYYKADQQMTPAIQAVINQSLALDPQDPSTLLLVGMDAFFTANYDKAIDVWQMILDSDRDDVDRTALMNAIASAKMRLGEDTSTMPNDTVQKAVTSNSKTVAIEISISPELADKVADTDTVFIFARATQGPKVPLAATKISASSLPATITLDDTTSMGGDVTLSSVQEVEIIAVLSKNGSVKPQSGDLKGTIKAIKVGENAALTLDTLVQ
jgi:cytochrome c-type biogenesis protein CcmH